MESHPTRYRTASLAILLLVLGITPAANAQLEEIVVTATKRVESLQEVPLSITAIDGAVLEKFSISNFYDMDIPGVNIAQGGMNDNAFIRGIGQSSGNFGFENSAPYYIDGVYFGRARGTRLAWLDAERIEVIKGPVPTYLGKNASAGAINITSRRPSESLEGFVDVYQEFEHNETVATGAIGGPLSDTFRVRAAAKYRNLDEGWMFNTAVPTDDPAQEDTLGRLSAEWDVTDSFQVFAKYEVVDAQWNGRNTQQFACAPTAVIDPALEDCIFNDTRAVTTNPDNYHQGIFSRELPPGFTFINDFDYSGGAIILEWSFGDVDLLATTGYYSFENTFIADASHSTFDRAVAEFFEDYSQLSQEIRLQSAGDGSLEWMAGVYFDSNENNNVTNRSIAPLNPAMNFADIRVNDEDADSWAVFGEVAFDLNDQWRATLGGRYTDYTKENTFTRTTWICRPPEYGVTCGPGFDFQAGVLNPMATFTIPDNEQSSDKFQPSLGIEFRPNDDHMYFLTYKEGFKAGGLDHQPVNPDPDLQRIDPEEAAAIELGARWTLLDGRARLNATIFSANYENLQVSVFDTLAFAFVTKNAGEATTEGVEIDTDFAISDNWTVGATLSFLNSKYDDYQNVTCWNNPPQTEAQGCETDPVTGQRSQDLSGEPLQFAPDFSGTLTVDFNQPIGSTLELFGNLSLFFTDDYVIGANGDPDLFQDSYSKVDLRLGLGAASGRWSVAVVGRNLGDEEVKEWAGDTPAAGGTSHFGLLKRTRQVALQGVFNFGE